LIRKTETSVSNFRNYTGKLVGVKEKIDFMRGRKYGNHNYGNHNNGERVPEQCRSAYPSLGHREGAGRRGQQEERKRHEKDQYSFSDPESLILKGRTVSRRDITPRLP
jgi:hypothetical protein